MIPDPSRALPPLSPPTPAKSLYVSLHDVAPRFSNQIQRAVDVIAPLVSGRLSAGVVPDWHGSYRDWETSRFGDFVRDRFPELLLHGMTHLLEGRSRLSLKLTGNPWEFSACRTSQAAAERAGRAQELFEAILGVRARGFLPPAWRLTTMCWNDWRSTGIEFLVRFRGIEFAGGGRWPLQTWSWDFGDAVGRGGIVGQWWADLTRPFRPGAIPCVALHPQDVDRGLLPRAADVIKRLLAEGRTPILPSEFLATADRAAESERS